MTLETFRFIPSILSLLRKRYELSFIGKKNGIGRRTRIVQARNPMNSNVRYKIFRLIR